MARTRPSPLARARAARVWSIRGLSLVIMIRGVPMEDRDRLSRQTARNLEGLELERAGRLEDALALYEQNVAEGFEGDWPYGRLVAAYERMGDLERALAVLERGIEVLGSSKRRTPADRRATVRAFRGRLRLVKRAIAARDRDKKSRRSGR